SVTSKLNATASYAPDGYIVSYDWSTGAVGVVATETFVTIPDTNPYTITTHPISVAVTDNSGLVATHACGNVTVCDQTTNGYCVAIAVGDTFSVE
ncbi:MAG: hypothetical protein L3J52_05660, partial [Proteobacteria bacterium]|nr:hypothetical protein [Pseudomonadota bacterium]